MASPFHYATLNPKQKTEHDQWTNFIAVSSKGIPKSLSVSSSNQAFLLCIKQGKLEEAKALLGDRSSQVDINVCESPQNKPFYVINPLLIAIKNNDLPMVKLLIEFGAKLPVYLSKHNITPLRLAVAFNVPAVAKYLILTSQTPEPELSKGINRIIGEQWTMQSDTATLAQPLVGITIQTGAVDILENLLCKGIVHANLIGYIETRGATLINKVISLVKKFIEEIKGAKIKFENNEFSYRFHMIKDQLLNSANHNIDSMDLEKFMTFQVAIPSVS